MAVGVAVVVAVALATLGTAAARQPDEAAWLVDERSTPDMVTIVIPRHAGAAPLAASAFRIVVEATQYPVTVARPVDQGIDLVVLLDSGRLGDDLLTAKGSAAELLLQLPASVRVLVWGASAAAPPSDVAPVAPADGVVALGTVQPAPPGDLGATLRALAGRLDPARRRAAVVVTPAGEHTGTLPQAFDDFEAGIELVDLPAVPADGQILAALDAYALELLGTYEVSAPAIREADAVLIALEDGPASVDLTGAAAPPTTAGTATTVTTQVTTETATRITGAPPVNTSPPRSPATLPPLSVELSTRVRSDGQTELLGMAAIGVAALLSAALLGLLFVRLRRARRGTPAEAERRDEPPAPPTLVELYGLHPDGTTAPACRLLCVVELASASRLDGVDVGLTEIRGALDGHGDSDLRRWVDLLHTSLLLRSRRPLDDRLRGTLERLGVRSDLAADAGRVARQAADASQLHRGLFEVGRPWGLGHRIAALGLALLDPFEIRPAPLVPTPFLSWGPDGPDDLAAAVIRATSWHETVKRRMLGRLLDRSATSSDAGRGEDPAVLVAGLLDRLVPTGAHRP